jgi:pimeloyl-ACP methyl ester carboxylesterase
VHIVDRDGDGPAVLLLGGCGVPYYLWDRVVRLLPGRRVIRMDRPGIGTPWPGRLPTLAEEIETLAELLSTVGSAAVITAHSMAGLHAEGLARRHPDLIAGLVLVDPSVESRPRSPGGGRAWLASASAVRQLMHAVPASRPFGSLADRLISSAQSDRLRLLAGRPDEQRTVFRSPDAAASVIAEQAAYDQQVADLFELRRITHWPQLPVSVLTAGGGGARWQRLQAGLARDIGAQHAVVEGSRHLMMADRPDAIADAIRLVSKS